LEPGLAPGFFVLGDAFTSAADGLAGCQRHFSLARLEQGAEDAAGGTGGSGFDAGEVEQAGAQRAGADRLPALGGDRRRNIRRARLERFWQPDQERISASRGLKLPNPWISTGMPIRSWSASGSSSRCSFACHGNGGR